MDRRIGGVNAEATEDTVNPDRARVAVVGGPRDALASCEVARRAGENRGDPLAGRKAGRPAATEAGRAEKVSLADEKLSLRDSEAEDENRKANPGSRKAGRAFTIVSIRASRAEY